MSTSEQAFRAARAAGRLVVWEPDRRGAAQRNLLALIPEVFEEVSHPWGSDDDDDEVLRQRVLATCAAFTSDQIPLSTLFKHVGGTRGISAMRILAPRPGVRIVGGFLSDTAFIGVALYRRDQIVWKRANPPSNPSPLEWKAVLDDARWRWDQMLPGTVPIVPRSIGKKRGRKT